MITTIIVVAALLIAALLFGLFLNLVAESDDEADWILEDDALRKEQEAARLETEQGLTSTEL